MQKDFDKWNQNKKYINSYNPNRFYHKRDIWWCSLGLNVGFEQDGKDTNFQRPVLILKGFSSNTCLVAPLTTSNKKHIYRIEIGNVDGKNASVILSQIKIIDTKRLTEKITVLEREIFETIRKSLKDML